MKKNLEKIFTSASVVVAIILIMVLIVTAFGGIKQEDFDNNLVKGLLFTLGILYLVLSIVSIVLIFINSEAIKDVILRSDKGGSIKVSAGVINKYVKSACSEIEGVKCQKVGLVSDEYGVRLKVNVKVVDKDVIEVETYLRTLLEDMFLKEFNFRFSSIEFKVTALVPKYKADEAEIEAAVAKKLEEMRKENEQEGEAPVPEDLEPVEVEDAPQEAEEAVEEAQAEDALPSEEPEEVAEEEVAEEAEEDEEKVLEFEASEPQEAPEEV